MHFFIEKIVKKDLDKINNKINYSKQCLYQLSLDCKNKIK